VGWIWIDAAVTVGVEIVTGVMSHEHLYQYHLGFSIWLVSSLSVVVLLQQLFGLLGRLRLLAILGSLVQSSRLSQNVHSLLLVSVGDETLGQEEHVLQPIRLQFQDGREVADSILIGGLGRSGEEGGCRFSL
jgi:hypothetical protein